VCQPKQFAVSPDGRLFASSGTQSYVAVVDWRGMAAHKEPLRDAVLNELWDKIASTHSPTAFRAVVELSATPAQATKLIGARLKPVPVIRTDEVKAWIAELGSEEFRTREAAERELAKLGLLIEAELQAAAKTDDPERRDRVNRLLKAIEIRSRTERLRALRALEVLEYTDTPAGRDVLKALAGGSPSARLTQEAKAALDRLRAADPKP
jgi:hypothetical protein